MDDVLINDVNIKNKRGAWIPAIPCPLYGLRKRCFCGKHFWTKLGYKSHYAYSHIMGYPEDY